MKILYATDLPLEELRLIGTGKKNVAEDKEHFLFPLISYFYTQGNEIVIVSTSRGIKSSERYCLPRMTIKIVKLEKHGNISAILGFRNDIQRIKRCIQEEEADIYHAHWSYEYAAACLEINSCKTIITVHDWPEKVCRAIGNYYWRRRLNLGNRVLRKGKIFTAVSPYIEHNIRRVNPSAHICVIPNYFCEDEFEEFMNNSSQSDSPKNVFHVLCVNNGFNGIKNTTIAMMAFSALHEKYNDVVLDMYGDGYERNGDANRWANDNLNTDSIVFHGRVSRQEIVKAFGTADVFLHTSHEESFGLVYLEAMASGTAIIAGRNSGATAWVLDNGRIGELINIDSVQEVYNSLEKLYTSNSLREKYLREGRSRLFSHFLFAQIVLDYQKIYEKTMTALNTSV